VFDTVVSFSDAISRQLIRTGRETAVRAGRVCLNEYAGLKDRCARWENRSGARSCRVSNCGSKVFGEWPIWLRLEMLSVVCFERVTTISNNLVSRLETQRFVTSLTVLATSA
jgi:hypothetical protein